MHKAGVASFSSQTEHINMEGTEQRTNKPSNISCSLWVSYPLFMLFCGYSAEEKHQADSPCMLLFAFVDSGKDKFPHWESLL